MLVNTVCSLFVYHMPVIMMKAGWTVASKKLLQMSVNAICHPSQCYPHPSKNLTVIKPLKSWVAALQQITIPQHSTLQFRQSEPQRKIASSSHFAERNFATGNF